MRLRNAGFCPAVIVRHERGSDFFKIGETLLERRHVLAWHQNHILPGRRDSLGIISTDGL